MTFQYTTTSSVDMASTSVTSAGLIPYARAGRYLVCFVIRDDLNVYYSIPLSPAGAYYVDISAPNPTSYSYTANYLGVVVTFQGSGFTTSDTVRILVSTASCSDLSSSNEYFRGTTSTSGVFKFQLDVSNTLMSRVCFSGSSWATGVWSAVYLSTTTPSNTSLGDLPIADFTPTVTSVTPNNVVFGEVASILVDGTDLDPTAGDIGYAMLESGTTCDADLYACSQPSAAANCTKLTKKSSTQVECVLSYYVVNALSATKLCMCYKRGGEAKARRLRSTVTILYNLPNPRSVDITRNPIRPGQLTYLILSTPTPSSLQYGQAMIVPYNADCLTATSVSNISLDVVNSTFWVMNSVPGVCFRLCFKTPDLGRWIQVPYSGSSTTAWPTWCGGGNMYVGGPVVVLNPPVDPRQRLTINLKISPNTGLFTTSLKQNDAVKLVPYNAACLFGLCSQKSLCEQDGSVYTVGATTETDAQVTTYIYANYTDFVVCYRGSGDSTFSPVPKVSGMSSLASDYVTTAGSPLPSTMTVTPSSQIQDEQVQIFITMVTGTNGPAARTLTKTGCVSGTADFVCPIVAPFGDLSNGSFTFEWDTIIPAENEAWCVCLHARSDAAAFVGAITIQKAQPTQVTPRQSTIPNTILDIVMKSRAASNLRAVADSIVLYRQIDSAGVCLCRTSAQCEVVPNSAGALRQENADTFLRFNLGLPLYSSGTYLACYSWVPQSAAYSIMTRLVIPTLSQLPISWSMNRTYTAYERTFVNLYAPTTPTFNNATCALVPFDVATRCSSWTTTTIQSLSTSQRAGSTTVSSSTSSFLFPYAVANGAYMMCCIASASGIIVEIPSYVNGTYIDPAVPITITPSRFTGYVVSPASPTAGQSFALTLNCSSGTCTCSDPTTVTLRRGANVSCWDTISNEIIAYECLQGPGSFNFRGVAQTEVSADTYTVCVRDTQTQGVTRMLRSLVVGNRNPARFEINFGIIVSGGQINPAVFTIVGTALDSTVDKIKIMPYDKSCHDPQSDTSSWRVFLKALQVTGSGTSVTWTIPYDDRLDVTATQQSYCTGSSKTTYPLACPLKLCYLRGSDGTYSMVPYGNATTSPIDDSFYLEGYNPIISTYTQPLYAYTFPEFNLLGYRVSSGDDMALYIDRTCKWRVSEMITTALIATTGTPGRFTFSALLNESSFMDLNSDMTVALCYRWASGRLVPVGTSTLTLNSAAHNVSTTGIVGQWGSYTPIVGESVSEVVSHASPPCTLSVDSAHLTRVDRKCNVSAKYTLLPRWQTNYTLSPTSIQTTTMTYTFNAVGTFTQCAVICGVVHVFRVPVTVGPSFLTTSVVPSNPRVYTVLTMTVAGPALNNNPNQIFLNASLDKIAFYNKVGFVSCATTAVASNIIYQITNGSVGSNSVVVTFAGTVS
eukprot:PhF_6_TR39687/c2_g1_i1/m.58990